MEKDTEKKIIYQCCILKTLADIDTIEDLYRYSPKTEQAESKNAKIKNVII